MIKHPQRQLVMGGWKISSKPRSILIYSAHGGTSGDLIFRFVSVTASVGRSVRLGACDKPWRLFFFVLPHRSVLFVVWISLCAISLPAIVTLWFNHRLMSDSATNHGAGQLKVWCEKFHQQMTRDIFRDYKVMLLAFQRHHIWGSN